MQAGPSQECVDTRTQLSDSEGLRDIVIPAAVQAAYDIDFFVGSGQENNGYPAVLPAHLLADMKACSVRKGNIQEKKIVLTDTVNARARRCLVIGIAFSGGAMWG